MANIKVNDILTGVVTGIETYGIFVNIDEYSGLVHISEISDDFVRNVRDYANVGDIIKVKILEINNKEHQLKLSIKSVEEKNKKVKREKIKETSQGFTTLQENLEGWVNKKIGEMNKK